MLAKFWLGVAACSLLFSVSLLANDALPQGAVTSNATAAVVSLSPEPVLLAANSTGSLPEAPHASLKGALPRMDFAVAPNSQVPRAPIQVGGLNQKVWDRKFLALHGLLFASTTADMMLIMRCRDAHACALVPDGLAHRHILYPTSLSVSAGATLLSYYLRSHNKRWWYVPAALLTVGHSGYAFHAAQSGR